jgi:hypothetical protein
MAAGVFVWWDLKLPRCWFQRYSPKAVVNAGKLLFAQLMDFLPWTSVFRSVTRYDGEHTLHFAASPLSYSVRENAHFISALAEVLHKSADSNHLILVHF